MKKLKNIPLYVWITILSLVVVLTFLFYQLPKQRNQQIDNLISSDLLTLSRAIDDYYLEKGEQPRSIRRLDVSDDIKERAKKYNYEYEKINYTSYKLCAEFKTDTRLDANDPTGGQLPILSLDEAIYPSYPSNPDVYHHKDGRECIEFNSYSYYDPYQYENNIYEGDYFNDDSYYDESYGEDYFEDSEGQSIDFFEEG